MIASMLLPMLCIPDKITTTSCSKVPQGLRFPLGVRGIFATQYFQKASTRDSDNLVKPFMQVAIQTTRYYAHYKLSLEKKPSKSSKKLFLVFFENFFVNLYIAIKFGLYLN